MGPSNGPIRPINNPTLNLTRRTKDVLVHRENYVLHGFLFPWERNPAFLPHLKDIKILQGGKLTQSSFSARKCGTPKQWNNSYTESRNNFSLLQNPLVAQRHPKSQFGNTEESLRTKDFPCVLFFSFCIWENQYMRFFQILRALRDLIGVGFGNGAKVLNGKDFPKSSRILHYQT